MSKREIQSTSIRQHFSISKEFYEVVDILNALPDRGASRFICEAIIHYDKVKSNPNWIIDQIREIVGSREQILHLEESLREKSTETTERESDPTPSPHLPTSAENEGVVSTNTTSASNNKVGAVNEVTLEKNPVTKSVVEEENAPSSSVASTEKIAPTPTNDVLLKKDTTVQETESKEDTTVENVTGEDENHEKDTPLRTERRRVPRNSLLNVSKRAGK